MNMAPADTSIPCDCWFCTNSTPHRSTSPHDDFYRVSDILLAAESLRPEDRIPVQACAVCGHKEKLNV